VIYGVTLLPVLLFALNGVTPGLPALQGGTSHQTWPCVTFFPCLSGFSLLITLLVLILGPACAGWMAMDAQYQSSGLQTLYVNYASLRRVANFVTMLTLLDRT
jgi:hypothetical protein